MTDRDQLRREIDSHLDSARWSAAQSALERLWAVHGSPALSGYVNSRYERLRGCVPFHPCRVAILRSFTVEPLLPLLRAAGWRQRLDLTLRAGEFNAYAQELLDPRGWIYDFAPDAAILAIEAQDIAPSLCDGFADRNAEEVRAAVDDILKDFRAWVLAFRSRSHASLILHTLAIPAQPARGIFDSQDGGQAEAIRDINTGLRRIAFEFPGVHLFDYDALSAAHGRLRWRDEQRWATVKLPLHPEAMLALAAEWVRYLCPVAGRACKVLAVDLDNTLWGGVVGEVGAARISASREYPGIAWWRVQRALLDMKRRGILLAICSKNNRADALEAFRANPGMLLRPEDFAAERINWQDKPSNLREIAAQLNVGTDSIAFVDDNPVEREHVRHELPEVTVIELPNDPMGFADAIRACPALERLAVSAEDSARSRYYAEQRQRASALDGATSLEEFYRSLAQAVEIAPVDAASLPRAAQLTQKTNQFNVTTRRYTEQRISEFARAPEWDVYTVRVRDRFGDNGIVGVMITRAAGRACEIDTFLLSCRVISRTVETAMLSFLAAESRARGSTELRGWFLPTAKNAPAAGLFANHGFTQAPAAEAGSAWTLDLSRADIRCPEWIHLSTPAATTGAVAAGQIIERAIAQ